MGVLGRSFALLVNFCFIWGKKWGEFCNAILSVIRLSVNVRERSRTFVIFPLTTLLDPSIGP